MGVAGELRITGERELPAGAPLAEASWRRLRDRAGHTKGKTTAMTERRMQIGEVAERTGLSLRTIRHYEDVHLVIPSARSKGGFRLYTDADVERLMVVRRMKPLGFSLDEMRDLLDITDRLAAHRSEPDPEEDVPRLRERLDAYRRIADARCETLRAQLLAAEDFAATLRHRLDRNS